MHPSEVDCSHLVLLPRSPCKALDARLNGLFHLSAEQQTMVWKYHNLFIHSPIEGHWGFTVLAIKNKVAKNMHVISFLVKISFLFSGTNAQERNYLLLV